jgi:hypothetical protein
MKITNHKAVDMDRLFFCLCDKCGSKVWLEDDFVVNSLEEDGGQLIPRTVSEFIKNCDKDEFPRCFECEKRVSIILFKTIGKKERMQIAKMTLAQRKLWVQNLKAVKELEKEDWKDEDEEENSRIQVGERRGAFLEQAQPS